MRAPIAFPLHKHRSAHDFLRSLVRHASPQGRHGGELVVNRLWDADAPTDTTIRDVCRRIVPFEHCGGSMSPLTRPFRSSRKGARPTPSLFDGVMAEGQTALVMLENVKKFEASSSTSPKLERSFRAGAKVLPLFESNRMRFQMR